MQFLLMLNADTHTHTNACRHALSFFTIYCKTQHADSLALIKAHKLVDIDLAHACSLANSCRWVLKQDKINKRM